MGRRNQDATTSPRPTPGVPISELLGDGEKLNNAESWGWIGCFLSGANPPYGVTGHRGPGAGLENVPRQMLESRNHEHGKAK